ncbi:MAG: hypothetical protein SOI56_04620 [Eubacteriales bacterium]
MSNTEIEISNSSLDQSKDSEAEPEDADNMASGDIIPSVMVNGKVYQDTGYISSAVGCGTMDGEITSTVDRSEMPSKDDQSNFGKGYGYQYGGENTVLVQMKDQMEIFRDIDSNDDSIPMQVACFIGKVKEIRDDSLLITYVKMPDDSPCLPLNDGDYIVSRENADSDINTGDTGKVWYSGSVEETDPTQLDACRIEKDTSE